MTADDPWDELGGAPPELIAEADALHLHGLGVRVVDVRSDNSMESRAQWLLRQHLVTNDEKNSLAGLLRAPMAEVERALQRLTGLPPARVALWRSLIAARARDKDHSSRAVAADPFADIPGPVKSADRAAALKRSASLANLMVQEVDLAPPSIMTAEQQARACGLDIAVSNRIEGTDTFGRADDFARFILTGERPDPFAGVRDCPG